MEGTTENLRKLVELIGLQRSFYGWSIDTLAKRAGVAKRTVAGWLRLEFAPGVQNRAALEEALGWLPGKVSEVLASDNPGQYTLDDVQRHGEPPRPRASELTDDELFFEVMHRFREWRDRPAGTLQAGGVDLSRMAPPSRLEFGLAANTDEEAPGEGEAPE